MGSKKGQGGRAPKERIIILWSSYNLDTKLSIDLCVRLSGEREPYEHIHDIPPEASQALQGLEQGHDGTSGRAREARPQEAGKGGQQQFWDKESETAKAAYPSKSPETPQTGLTVNPTCDDAEDNLIPGFRPSEAGSTKTDSQGTPPATSGSTSVRQARSPNRRRSRGVW